MTDQTRKAVQEQDAAVTRGFAEAIRQSDATIATYDETHASRPPAEPLAWQNVGPVRSHTSTPDQFRLRITCENTTILYEWLSDESVHIRADHNGRGLEDAFSYLLHDRTPTVSQWRLSETDQLLIVETATHQYEIERETGQLTILTLDGDLRCATNGSPRWVTDGPVALDLRLQPDEACFGTGERAFDLNLRGRRLILENVDPGGYQRGDDPINYCMGFLLGVHDQSVYGLLWDNTYRGFIDAGNSQPDTLTIQSEAGPLSYLLFVGDDVNTVLNRYTRVTGRMPLPPLWALGYQQSRYSYMTQQEVLEIARRMRAEKVPCDVIYLDIDYMDEKRIFTWNQDAFPDLKGLIDELHAMDMKLVVILDPGVQVKEGYAGHDTGIERDVFLKYPDGERFAGVVWPGLCYFPDFTDPDVRSWWADQLEELLTAGVDGIWNDMNEPLIFQVEAVPRSLPDYIVHSKEGRGGTHHELRNVYGMLMGQASFQALERYRPGKRQFSITRSGAVSAQRHTLSWTGDNYSTWDDLRVSLSMILQMGLSGMSFVGSDIGGFNWDTTGELLTRWTQAGALLPFFRNHTGKGSAHQEPWVFGRPYTDAIRDAIALRYQLMPYLYTAFAECAFEGHPIIRPLFTAQPDQAALRDIDDCFLVGDRVLVTPVLFEHVIRRTLYLPEGDWYDFHTNRRYTGGQMISVDAPLDRLPVFVRSGTVLPLWETAHSTAAYPPKKLRLRAYTDSGVSTHYEDAGEGLAYRDDEYRWTTFEMIEETRSLVIERTTSGSYLPNYDATELELIGASQTINEIHIDGRPITQWQQTPDYVRFELPAEWSRLVITS